MIQVSLNSEARHVMWCDVEGVLTPLPPHRLERSGLVLARTTDIEFLLCWWITPLTAANDEESRDGNQE